jgi:hypothetical protein
MLAKDPLQSSKENKMSNIPPASNPGVPPTNNPGVPPTNNPGVPPTNNPGVHPTHNPGMPPAQGGPGYAPQQPVHRPQPAPSETKQAFKTTEFYAFIAVSLAVLIASAVVDNGEDGQGFGADKAWLYVTLLAVGYMISRGLAKAGSRFKDSDR